MARRVRWAGLALLLLSVPLSARSQPTLGFIEHWSDGTTRNWGASQDVLTNPGTGGADGAGDGYLHIATTLAAHLGAHSTDTPYVGDWLAANIDRVRFRLNDTDANQNLEIHFAFGNSGNLWQSNQGFAPPENAWAQFTVDLTDSTQFTHIISFSGGFAAALQNVTNVLIRHDKAPYVQTPDALQGEFGLDDFELTNPLVAVGPLPPGVVRPIELGPPYPNPARGRVACSFDVFDASPVRVVVVDAAGRIVHAETLPGLSPGRRTWMWNGLDDRGAAAPAGAYRVRVTGAAGGTSRPFVLLR